MRAAAVAMCVAAVLPASIGARPIGVMPFERGADGGVVVEVRLNGQGPFRFLLDTGSSHSAITERTARRLRAPAVAKAVLDSSIGSDMVPVVRLDLLEAGSIVMAGVMPSVMRDAAIDPSREIDGVLGQDVLASRRYTIDFRSGHVDWRGDPAPRGGLRSTFVLEPREGRFLVTLPQPGAALRLVPDSGASTLLFFDDGGPWLPAMIVGPRRELTTMTARREVTLATVRELQVGLIVVRHVPAVLAAPRRQPDGGPRTDGLLPLHLFDRVTFDGPRRLLVLEKQA
jgi:Aspartyl protease